LPSGRRERSSVDMLSMAFANASRKSLSFEVTSSRMLASYSGRKIYF
jgi:hypothetical protein